MPYFLRFLRYENKSIVIHPQPLEIKKTNKKQMNLFHTTILFFMYITNHFAATSVIFTPFFIYYYATMCIYEFLLFAGKAMSAKDVLFSTFCTAQSTITTNNVDDSIILFLYLCFL